MAQQETGAIRPADDFFHERPDDPYWNESAWFPFSIPEKKIQVWVYFYHRPNMNYSVGGVFIWDPSGDLACDCLYYDWGDTFPLAPTANMFDFTLPNSLSAKCIEPLNEFQLRYNKPGCEFDFVFKGAVPPHHTPFPAEHQSWGIKGHYEQIGRLTGTLKLNGEKLAVDSWCLRDHSWGPRQPKIAKRANFPWAIASERSAFVVFATSNLPIDTDPVFGTIEQVDTGWYLKDGVYGELSQGECSVLERGKNGEPLRMVISATDHLGRRLEAEGRANNTLRFHGYPFTLAWLSQYEWCFDGQMAYGEAQDFQPLQQARCFLRSLKK